MGEYKAANGTRSFQPDDTATEFYIASNYTAINLGHILELAHVKWGDGIDINDLEVEAEYIHTDCLGYDSYDPGDYTRYLRIEYNPSEVSISKGNGTSINTGSLTSSTRFTIDGKPADFTKKELPKGGQYD